MAHSWRVWSILVVKAAAGCIVPTAMKQRERQMSVLSSLSPFIHGAVLPTFTVGLPTSVNPIQMILHRHSRKLVA